MVISGAAVKGSLSFSFLRRKRDVADFTQVLDTIKDRLDIVEVVSERVSLKRRGRNWVGLCPFHTEKTPSFTVSQEKQMFYCFGCGAGGDVITFWMKSENLDFPGAIRDLADRLGIEVPENKHEKSSQWEKYLSINQAAMAFFSKVLYSDGQGKQALLYLKKRGLSPETIKEFKLGFAPGSYGLEKYFKRQGLSPEDAVSIGLLKKKGEDTFVPVFRNRIIFPIEDERGRVVGFGGRILGNNSQPKYLNTPDSRIYQKGRLFYGASLTRKSIAGERKAVLVEGYLDLIALYQLGIKNGVAALGTAFTDQHARRLNRWADTVFLLFDGDEAGEKASTRALEKLIRAGMIAYQCVLPRGKDPGDFLSPSDSAGLTAVIETAEDALILRVKKARDVENGRDGGDISNQEKHIKEVLDLLRKIPDRVRLDLYLKQTSEILGLNKNVLYDIIQNSDRSFGLRIKKGVIKEGTLASLRFGSKRTHLPRRKMEDPEEMVLKTLVQHPGLSTEVSGEGILEMFKDRDLKLIGGSILKEINLHGSVDTSSFIQTLDEKAQAVFSRLAMNMHQVPESEARKAFMDSVKILYARETQEKIAALDKEIKDMENSGNYQETLVLLKRRREIKQAYGQKLITLNLDR